MVRIVNRGPRRSRYPGSTGDVTLAEVADLPVGVSVTALIFGPGSSAEVGPATDMKSFVVIGGDGAVDSEESGQQALTLGVTAFVPAFETAVLSSESGMTVVAVFGGWLPPP